MLRIYHYICKNSLLIAIMRQNYTLQQFNFNSIITINNFNSIITINDWIIVIKQWFGIITVNINHARAFEEIMYFLTI